MMVALLPKSKLTLRSLTVMLRQKSLIHQECSLNRLNKITTVKNKMLKRLIKLRIPNLGKMLLARCLQMTKLKITRNISDYLSGNG